MYRIYPALKYIGEKSSVANGLKVGKMVADIVTNAHVHIWKYLHVCVNEVNFESLSDLFFKISLDKMSPPSNAATIFCLATRRNHETIHNSLSSHELSFMSERVLHFPTCRSLTRQSNFNLLTLYDTLWKLYTAKNNSFCLAPMKAFDNLCGNLLHVFFFCLFHLFFLRTVILGE